MTFTLIILCLLFVSLVANAVQSARNTDMRQQRDDAVQRTLDAAVWKARWQDDHRCPHDHLHSLDCSDEVKRNALGEALFFDRLNEARAEVERLRREP